MTLKVRKNRELTTAPKDGDVGPMGLPAGPYRDNVDFTRTSEVVPIVEHNGEYWYPAKEGTLRNSEPSASNTAWKKAENFQVMFVRILFAQFARLGEAIFHGKYMFSQLGIINGTSSSQYDRFNPDDPDNETNAQRFAPNLYFNFQNGAARLAAGKAKFNADGSGTLAGGNIKWNTAGDAEFSGIIKASGGEFGGYIKTSYKKITESDATNIGIEDLGAIAVCKYRLNNDLNIDCEGDAIILPTTEAYVGRRASFLAPSLGIRSNWLLIHLRCANGILGWRDEDGGYNETAITELSASMGIVELLCVKDAAGTVKWCIVSLNAKYVENF